MNKLIIWGNNNKEVFVNTNFFEIKDFENWEYNRRLNEDKVIEIKNNLKKKNLLDTVLSYVYIENDNKFILFDGQHRVEAMKQLYEEDYSIINCICYIYYIRGLNYNINKIQIDKIIKDLFSNKNLQTPLANIDIEKLDQIDNNLNINLRGDIIHSVFLKFRNDYAKFYKTNNNPRRPNFNEYNFKNLCNEIEFETKEELEEELRQINEERKLSLSKTKITEKMSKKCLDSNFYLFI